MVVNTKNEATKDIFCLKSGKFFHSINEGSPVGITEFRYHRVASDGNRSG